jgi:hypothetical protein
MYLPDSRAVQALQLLVIIQMTPKHAFEVLGGILKAPIIIQKPTKGD